MSLLVCKDLAFSYDGNEILSGINFQVDSGDYLCIVGQNGAGKSTLVKGLLNLKKPSSGTIEVGEGLQPNEIGCLPQQTQAQKNFPASVNEVVLSGCLNSKGMKPFYSKKDKRDVMEKLNMLGIGDLKDTCYHNLSGGQQQRVLLARALCATKKLVLLDEPVTGLDPLIAAEMYRLIEILNKERGITVIMVSHDIREAVKHADHILHLGNGQLFFGKTRDYLKSDTGRFFVLGEVKC